MTVEVWREGKAQIVNVRLTPRWTSVFVNPEESDRTAMVYLDGPELQDATREHNTIGADLSLEIPDRDWTDVEVAKAAAVAILTAEFHEVIEWVTVNGKRLAEPHPWDANENAETFWALIHNDMARLLNKYIKTYPST